jgi:hypothetical protein
VGLTIILLLTGPPPGGPVSYPKLTTEFDAALERNPCPPS